MSAATPATPKTPRTSKPKGARKAASHPTYSAMVSKSISELKDGSVDRLAFPRLTQCLGAVCRETLRESRKRQLCKCRRNSVRLWNRGYMMTHYKLGDNPTKINNHLRMALKRGVTSGELEQVKGSGASGSFRLGVKKTSAHSKASAKKPTIAKSSKSSKKATSKMSKAEKKLKTPKRAKAPKAKSASKKPMVKMTKSKSSKAKMSKTKTAKRITV